MTKKILITLFWILLALALVLGPVLVLAYQFQPKPCSENCVISFRVLQEPKCFIMLERIIRSE